MVSVFKIVAMIAAYTVLWDALGRWRVRGPERKLQLQVYGAIAASYVFLCAFTGGVSPALPGSFGTVNDEYFLAGLIHGSFGAYASIFLLLGTLEIAVSAGFYDPSMPLLSRWWVRALFEGPVWHLLCQRQAGRPFSPEEADAAWRHMVAGVATMVGALWCLQIGLGNLEWIKFDPVAILILLRAANIWLDARIRHKESVPGVSRVRPVGYHPCPGDAAYRGAVDRGR